ncbi:MAG: hypothetical protein WCZ65_04505 [Lysobacteraceae bacterium]
MNTYFRTSFMLLAFLPWLGDAAAQTSTVSAQNLIVEFEDLRNLPSSEDNPVLFYGFGDDSKFFAFHDGSHRIYREGEPFPAGSIGDRFLQADPDARIGRFVADGNTLNGGNQYWYGMPAHTAEPDKHRYLSYYFSLCPSDDAFIANEVPIEIFDENGNFTGPLIIEIYGSEVMDAGRFENNETDLPCLDHSYRFDGNRIPTDEPVHRHPGFNGSQGNPDATPVRILGAQGEYMNHNNQPRQYDYKPEYNDFTRPDFLIGRLRVVSGPHGGFNGTYYSPRFDGEGVTIEVFGDWENRRASFAWYTYLPDGSGQPIFLTGVAPVGQAGTSAEFTLYSAHGGIFASPENPERVETTLWGTARLLFIDCQQVRLDRIVPEDPAWEAPDSIQLLRLTPLPTGMERYCGGAVVGLAPVF